MTGSAPELFGNGCFIGNVTGSFWIFHLILLINETSAFDIFFIRMKCILTQSTIFIAMLGLTLVKSYYSATRTETGHIISRGYRLVAHDGIAYYILVACKAFSISYVSESTQYFDNITQCSHWQASLPFVTIQWVFLCSVASFSDTTHDYHSGCTPSNIRCVSISYSSRLLMTCNPTSGLYELSFFPSVCTPRYRVCSVHAFSFVYGAHTTRCPTRQLLRHWWRRA